MGIENPLDSVFPAFEEVYELLVLVEPAEGDCGGGGKLVVSVSMLLAVSIPSAFLRLCLCFIAFAFVSTVEMTLLVHPMSVGLGHTLVTPISATTVEFALIGPGADGSGRGLGGGQRATVAFGRASSHFSAAENDTEVIQNIFKRDI